MHSSSSTTDREFFEGADDTVARRQYREVIDTVADGVYELSSDLRFAAVNDAFVATTGYARDELLGEHVSLLLDADDVERLDEELDRQYDSADATPIELSVRTARGETIPCVVQVSPLPPDAASGGSVGVVRREGETRSLHGSSPVPKDVLLTLIDETEGGFFLLDDNFDIVWADETVGRFFGVDSDRLIGRDKRQVVREIANDAIENPGPFARRVLATYDDNSYTDEFTVHVTADDGRDERWLEHRSKPITSGQYAGGRIEWYSDISDRKQSADALKETEEQFWSLVDAVTEYAIFSLDPAGNITSWNQGAKDIKGYEAEEIVGEHISAFYTPEDRAAGAPERNLDVAAEEGSVENEGWRVRKDGSWFWANVTITAVHDEDGTHEGYLKVTRDMTEQHKHQEKVENELHSILERVSDGFFGLDEEWRFTYINDRAAELIEVSPEEATGEVIWDVFPDAVDSTFDLNYRRAMREQEPVAFEEYFPPLDLWFDVSAYPSETGLSVYFRDVTERREREQALREREEELQAYKNYIDDILNAIDDLFYVVDREGRFQRWNKSVRTVTGYSDDEIEAMDPLEAIVEADREQFLDSVRETFETGNSRFEARVRTKDGREVPIEFVASAVRRPDGDRVIAGIGRDVTERKRRQRQLEESNERLEQFAYAASHDLQEPLRMVSSYLRLIEDRYADALDEDGEEFLEFAVDGADRMREMINGLLEYSRIESRGDPFAPVDLEDVVDDVLETLQMMCDEHDAEITVAELPRVEGDRGQLRQLFQNLLENAMTYSGDEPPRIHIDAERECDQWVLSVSDAGIGIDPSDTDRIFEVFQSLDSPDGNGSGIGLALCKRIVERHEGDIWVESSLGEGTTFSFTLPAVGEDSE